MGEKETGGELKNLRTSLGHVTGTDGKRGQEHAGAADAGPRPLQLAGSCPLGDHAEPQRGVGEKQRSRRNEEAPDLHHNANLRQTHCTPNPN